MNKNILFLILLIFLMGVVSSATLSMSPPQLDFVGNTGEKICSDLFLNIGGEGVLIGEDRWAEQDFLDRKLSAHNLIAEDLKIEINYLKEINLSGEKIVNVCVVGKNSGNYHGVLLYRLKDTPVKQGIWINVSLDKSRGASRITGGTISEGSEDGFVSVFVLIGILLLVVLIYLVMRLKRKKKTEFSKS